MQALDLVYDVAVIGGGAAGMIAAVRAAERNKKVLLLEKAEKPGRKILASGNGRCNLMNRREPRYFGDTRFALQVLQKCTPEDLNRFFQKYGLILTEEQEGRVYPATYQAGSVVSVLKNAMKLTDVTLRMNAAVHSVCRKESCFEILTGSGDSFHSLKVIVTCGGAAQPKLGGSCDGYHILESMGHKIFPVSPALVPLNTDAKSISGLSGIRIRCIVRLVQDERIIREESGEVLFTDYGVSGICIMQCARFADQPGTYIQLDFLKNVFPDRISAMKEMKRRKKLFASCSPLWLLNGILPEKIAFAVLKQAGLALRGETASDIGEKELEKIVQTGCSYRIDITGNRGLEYAQVTAGGADCSEFDPSTMQSRLIPGLFAAGETMNVDGDCGGYNLMFAFASGLLAGSAV